MQDALENIKAAWESRPAAGQVSSGKDGDELSKADHEIVRMADAYVLAHPEVYTDFEDKNVHECVQALEVFRNTGMIEREWQTQTWIFHKFEFQNIGGEAQAQIRFAPEVAE